MQWYHALSAMLGKVIWDSFGKRVLPKSGCASAPPTGRHFWLYIITDYLRWKLIDIIKKKVENNIISTPKKLILLKKAYFTNKPNPEKKLITKSDKRYGCHLLSIKNGNLYFIKNAIKGNIK